MDKTQIFLAKIHNAESITLTTHIYPDADGIGSEISLCMALREYGKKAICINEEPLLDRYKYMDPDDVVYGLDTVSDQEKGFKDLLIVVDTNSTKRIGQRMEHFSQDFNDILYIDHHPASVKEKEKHCIDTNAAATGELVGNYIKALGISFNVKLALPIYTSIIIDTSSFRYPSVTGSTHRLIAELLDTGLKPAMAYNGIYGTKQLHHMHLLGKILATANTNKSGEVAWICLHKKLLDDFGTDIEDTHGFINNLLILDNIKVACMFREDPGEVKISFRSTGDYDVGNIARALGGGGHSHSAATVWPKENGIALGRVVDQVVEKIETIFKKSDNRWPT